MSNSSNASLNSAFINSSIAPSDLLVILYLKIKKQERGGSEDLDIFAYKIISKIIVHNMLNGGGGFFTVTHKTGKSGQLVGLEILRKFLFILDFHRIVGYR